MLEPSFLTWLRSTTEARWADTALTGAASGLGGPAWQPGTRWRGGLTASDLDIVEAMFEIRLPAAYREFLCALHTPDPPLAGTEVRGSQLVRVERRLFTDWSGATTPVLAALERPVDGLLRMVALGRWHSAWGEPPADERGRGLRVRRLAAAAPRLIPLAGQRYLVAAPGCDDGPVIAVHGADVAVVAPDLRSGLLRELGLVDPGRAAAVEPAGQLPERIPFWSDVIDGLHWAPVGAVARS